jgi:hypothetical protein
MNHLLEKILLNTKTLNIVLPKVVEILETEMIVLDLVPTTLEIIAV